MNVYRVDPLPTVLDRVGCIRVTGPGTKQGPVGVAPSFSAAKSFILSLNYCCSIIALELNINCRGF